MKANEFVKKFGVSRTRYWIKEFTEINKLPDEMLNIEYINDLKRIVNSHELVSDYYGLARAKEHAESNYTAPELKAALKQAIADVEACKEVS